ncbi:MAG: hypothetical protein WBA74_01835 [Cyclobacteriaceae bacterium]
MINSNYLKAFALLFACLFAFSCTEKGTEDQVLEKVTYQSSDEQTINSFTSWLNTTNGRLANSFDVGDIYTINENEEGYILHGAVDINDPSRGIAFSLVDGKIVNPFVTETKNLSGNEIETKIRTLDGELLYTLVDQITDEGVVRTVSSHAINGRTEGWWSDFDDCIGAFHNPTGCNICDIAFVIVADAATATLYSWLSLPVCAGVATGRN